MRDKILALPRRVKQGIVIGADVFLSLLATSAAFYLRLDQWAWPHHATWYAYLLAASLMLPIFIRLGLYRAVFRYSGLFALVKVVQAVALYGALYFCLLFWLQPAGVPRSIGVLQPLIFLVLAGGARTLARFVLNHDAGRHSQRVQGRVVIYGAGRAGVQIADALLNGHIYALKGFLDDDKNLIGKTINGRRVYAPEKLGWLIKHHRVTDVFLALPSISRAQRNQIIDGLRHHAVHIRSLPDFADITQGRVSISDIRELDVEDLLGRAPVPPNPELLARNIRDKVVMVTGAGGSIGSELCRQIIHASPKQLLLIEHSEYGLYAIDQELRALAKKYDRPVDIVPLLGSVRDAERMNDVCRAWKPSTVYHAAAYKHVPLVEHNPAEGLLTNVFGTLAVAQAAVNVGVADFVLVSTDKAVRPTNIMGASKRLAEMILQALAEIASSKGGTRFSMVRFGNVLGSSGSVVPLFREQIRHGGPITLTHENVTRFFMTIPEAAQLVIQAAAMAEGGDVFVLDMGEPVRIMDLARRIVELSGLTVRDDNHPDGDIAIHVTGLRPGEKLYEELLIGNDPQPTAHQCIMKAREKFVSWEALQPRLTFLRAACQNNHVPNMRALLAELVDGFAPDEAIVDWLWQVDETMAA